MRAPLNRRARRSIRRAAAAGGVTLADVMAAGPAEMRAAWRWLKRVEIAGRLVRRSGAGRFPFRWAVMAEVRA